MPAYKDNKGRWYCKFYADTWDGNKKQILKRGFSTKKEALAYEYEYKANTSHSPDLVSKHISSVLFNANSPYTLPNRLYAVFYSYEYKYIKK